MLLETAIIAGVKFIAAHGGLASWLASNAVSTASTAGIGVAAVQTAGTVAAIGATATVLDGTVKAIDGLVEGKPAKAAYNAARAYSGTSVH